MILSGKTIRNLCIITPHEPKGKSGGLSYGESACGYDIRLGKPVFLKYGCMTLGVSLEHFNMPNNVAGRVHDKSTNARSGILVQNTFIEPGWRGFLTLELTAVKHIDDRITESMQIMLPAGYPIAQIVFEYLDCEADGYFGKYQNQPDHPVDAIYDYGEAV